MWEKVKNTINGLNVLEIGGPTHLFRHSMLIYDILKSVDGLNMIDNVWQRVGIKYNYYNGKTGIQYIGDVADVGKIDIQKKYQLILTSHVIEHIANPIKVIKSLKPLLVDNGLMLSIIPNKEQFWDREREFTTIEHMIEDYNNEVGEDDMTHLEENIKVKKISKDPKDNYKHRMLHHHCFNVDIVKELFEYSGYETIECFVHTDKLQIVYLGKK